MISNYQKRSKNFLLNDSLVTKKCKSDFKVVKNLKIALIFLPGLTADHRLFDKQIEYFKNKFRVLVWDAPGHAVSYPFKLDFDLFDEAKWLDKIITKEGIIC